MTKRSMTANAAGMQNQGASSNHLVNAGLNAALLKPELCCRCANGFVKVLKTAGFNYQSALEPEARVVQVQGSSSFLVLSAHCLFKEGTLTAV